MPSPFNLPVIPEPYRDHYRSESDSEWEYNITTNSSMYETLLMQCLWQLFQYIDWDENNAKENKQPTDNGQEPIEQNDRFVHV